MRTDWQRRRGFDASPGELVEVACGDFFASFDSSSGFLRDIRFRGQLALYGLYAAVRDHNWDTVEPEIPGFEISIDDDACDLRFHACCRDRDVHFEWDGRISYRAGRLSFQFSGQAKSPLRRNRIGFCVLHPTCCAGQPCTVETVDGATSATYFPDLISPHQPMKEMRSISHLLDDGTDVKVTMLGDTFEMEDQRNWTDASYKTYCTPLELPFPVSVEAGERVEQEILVEFTPTEEESRHGAVVRDSVAETELVIETDGEGYVPPKIGLGASSVIERLDPVAVDTLRGLKLDHIRYDVELNGSWQDQLLRAGRESNALGVACEFALFLSGDPKGQLQSVRREVESAKIDVARWLVFHQDEKSTSARWTELASEVLSSLGAPIASGTNAYFTELNRERPVIASLDEVCYSFNPQVHAFDDRSLVDTLPVQKTTLDSARSFCGDRRLVVSPITLSPRFNPNATGAEPAAEPGELPSQVDPRQMSLFGGVWTLGSLAAVVAGRAHSVTYFETVGWRGVMESDQGNSATARFPSTPGMVFPVFHLLRDFGDARASASESRCHVSELGSDAVAMLIRTDKRRRLMVGNLTLQKRVVTVRMTGADQPGTATATKLDETNYEAASRRVEPTAPSSHPSANRDGSYRIELMPYAYTVLEFIV